MSPGRYKYRDFEARQSFVLGESSLMVTEEENSFTPKRDDVSNEPYDRRAESLVKKKISSIIRIKIVVKSNN
jgi:hypothetical protein